MSKNPLIAPEVLEARIAPATFHWITGGNGNWNDEGNWFNETTNQAADGFPDRGGIAKFVGVLEQKSQVTIPDGVTIVVDSILFDDDFGYKIVEEGTGKLQIYEEISVAGTNSAEHEILVPLELRDDVTISQDSPASLLIGGEISGRGDIQKTGTGTLRFGGSSANTYDGATIVVAGTLELAKTGQIAIPGSLTIADPAADLVATVRLFGPEQIEALPLEDLPLLMNPSGVLDLNGFDETIGRLILQAGATSGSTVTSGTGTLRIGDLFLGVSGTGAVGARISGKLQFSGSHDFDVANGAAAVDLLIDADITALKGGILGKEGRGHLQLNGTNTLPTTSSGYGLFLYRGTLGVDGSLSGAVGFSSVNNPTLMGTGTVNGIVTITGTVAPGTNGPGILTSTGNVDLGTAFNVDLNGTNPGTEYDQLVVTGSVDLSGSLLISLGYVPAEGDVLTIINNDGNDPVTGAFINQPDGSLIRIGNTIFRVDYSGGDGNDVTLEAFVPQLNISANGKTATFTDVDGDLVTIKTTRGSFQPDDFQFTPTGNSFDGLQLSLLNLSDDAGEFANADITITAKRGAVGGNGFVNVGYINATGVDLGKVTVAGDLGRITAGDGSKVGIKSLTLGSLGQLGTTTQGVNGSIESVIEGGLGKLVVKGDVRNDILVSGADGSIGSITIGSLNGGALRVEHEIGAVSIRGSITGTSVVGSGSIVSAHGNIGAVKIGGSIYGGTANFSGSIRADAGSIKSVLISGSVSTSELVSQEIPAPFGDGSIMAGAALGPVTIRGDVLGKTNNPVTISAGGSVKGPVKGVDLAIKSVAVAGNLEWARVLAGYDTAGIGRNADASIGTINVGGDWIASTVLAGVHAGEDLYEGTNDDAKLSGEGIRDNATAFSQIASIVIKGQAYGGSGSQSFGIVAEQIKSARISTIRLPLNPLPQSGDDFFPLAPTGPGPTDQASNFTLLEVLPRETGI